MSPDERTALAEKWNFEFASQVKKERGVYIYDGFRWHASSFTSWPAWKAKRRWTSI